MTDPKRWRETEDERAKTFLAELSKVEVSVEARDTLWAKLAATLPVGTGSGSPGGGREGAPPSKAPTPSGMAGGTKLIAAAAAVVGMGAIAIAIITTSLPVATNRTAQPVVPLAVETVASAQPGMQPSPIAPDSPSSVEASEPSPPPSSALRARARAGTEVHGAPVPSAAPAKADRLREETEGVRRARQLLRDKNPAAALAELDRLATLVPGGPLEEEREVLTIEALVASARTDDARRRADRFLFERPQSVHAPRVRALGGL